MVALKETGTSHAEIARRLSLSEASVATLLHRAKGKGYEVVMVLEGDPLGLYEQDDVEESE